MDTIILLKLNNDNDWKIQSYDMEYTNPETFRTNMPKKAIHISILPTTHR